MKKLLQKANTLIYASIEVSQREIVSCDTNVVLANHTFWTIKIAPEKEGPLQNALLGNTASLEFWKGL